MRRVALTGGIACGKSLVAKYLNELGVETIDADDIVHELIPADERRRLAKIVFNDPAARKALESRVHPIVKERINNRIVEWANNRMGGGDRIHPHSSIRSFANSIIPPIAVVPLLFEVHWDAEFDIICCVKSEKATQVERMMTTRGYSREEAEARLAAQMPVAAKVSKSQYVIDNDGSAEELKAKVAGFVAWLNGTLSATR